MQAPVLLLALAIIKVVGGWRILWRKFVPSDNERDLGMKFLDSLLIVSLGAYI